MSQVEQETCEAVAFVGNTLGPFFSLDPKLGADELEGLAQAMTGLEVEQAADDWPFVERPAALRALGLMREGLADGLASETLVDEYRRLFVGPAPKAAPPWGSVYTDPDSVVFGASTIALKDWLAHEGITVTRGASDEPEDHIGTMLSLMAWIAQNRPDALAEYLADHLLTWAPRFLKVMEGETTHLFYQGLAQLTHESLLGIQKALALKVEPPRFYR